MERYNFVEAFNDLSKLYEEANIEKATDLINKDKANSLSFDEFIDNAEVVLVDDAESFDINQWESDYQQDVLEELDEFTEPAADTSEIKFVKYKLDDDQVKKVIEKISTGRFDVLDGVTSWKTRQFLKKTNLTLDDLQQVLCDLKEEDYKINSKPIDDKSGFNEAIIFIKNSKINELGPFKLYIKLDYDTIEETPIIIISIHRDFKDLYESLEGAEVEVSAVPVVVATEAPVEAPAVVAPEVPNEAASCVEKTANDVMAAYQNANKWLDSVKEAIYTKMSCPFFSSFVHELAHTMPQRFDAFGDILHTINMEIPYPATAEIAKKPATIQESFDIIFSCLDAIKAALNEFIKCTDEQYHGMACAAEACLNDIEGEYPMLYRLRDKANECGEDTVTFDKFVGQYQEHKGDLLESLIEANHNFASDHAKTALLKKYNKLNGTDIKKSQCILHHLNGDHSDDKDLANDVLIVAKNKEDAKMAHTLLHLLSYCYIASTLTDRLNSLGVEFFYQPDNFAEPMPLSKNDLFRGLVNHNSKLRDLSKRDETENGYTIGFAHTEADSFDQEEKDYDMQQPRLKVKKDRKDQLDDIAKKYADTEVED